MEMGQLWGQAAGLATVWGSMVGRLWGLATGLAMVPLAWVMGLLLMRVWA